jgi:hypothetical protein
MISPQFSLPQSFGFILFLVYNDLAISNTDRSNFTVVPGSPRCPSSGRSYASLCPVAQICCYVQSFLPVQSLHLNS